MYKKTDLEVPDVLSASVRRTYRPGDGDSYSFGIGTTSLYDVSIWAGPTINGKDTIDFYRPDGGRVRYMRTNPGSPQTEALYEAQSSPGRFFKSTIRWNVAEAGWDLRFRDGAVYAFGNFTPLRAIRDRFGNELRLTRANGGSGRVTQLTTPNGRWIKLAYDSASRVTEARDNGGRTEAYTYNSAGFLTAATDPGGGRTTYNYDAGNRMASVTDPRGITFLRTTYDSNGRAAEQTTADGATHRFAYTLNAGKVERTKVTGPRGAVREVTFNFDGYSTRDVRDLGGPAEQVTTYEREVGTNLMRSATDPLGRRTALAYDTRGNTTDVTRAQGTAEEATTRLAYEPRFNQPSTVTDPGGRSQALTYDDRGRPTAMRDASGRDTTLSYTGADGRPTAITNPAGETTTPSYDGADLVSVTDSQGNTSKRYSDAIGRPVHETDPLGNRTRYAFDPNNSLTKVTDPVGAETTMAYDPNGNPTRVTDARGNSRETTYDPMDRPEVATDPLGRTERFAYDLSGNLTRRTDRKGQVTSARYDALERPIFQGFGAQGAPGSETHASTIALSYDRANRLTAAEDSQAGTHTQAYDALDRLTQQGGPQGTVSYAYDRSGRRTQMDASGQPATSYSYDPAGRLTGLSRGAQSVSMAYDAAGRPQTTTLPNGITRTDGYDSASRLTSILYKRGTEALGELEYEYDSAGRRTAQWGTLSKVALPEEMSSATYNAANQQTERAGQTQAYDPNGNLTSDGENAYTWNARGELASLEGPGQSATFRYDPFGRRSQKTVGGALVQGQSTDYLYDGQNVVKEQRGSESTDLLQGGPDEIFARTKGGQTDTFLRDGLGSTASLARASGAPQTAYRYDPFGGSTEEGEPAENDWRFTGREDDGTGLLHYRARYMDSGSGRFASEDPIGLAGGDPNLYAYVGGDPVNAVDPSGLSIFMDISEAAAGELDGLFAGLPSKAFGISCWDSDQHRIGQWFGGIGGGVGVAGATRATLLKAGNLAKSSSPIMQFGKGRPVIIPIAGASGGTYSGYAGNGMDPTSSQVARSALVGGTGAVFGDVGRAFFHGPGTGVGPAFGTAFGLTAHTAIGGIPGGNGSPARKDGCG